MLKVCKKCGEKNNINNVICNKCNSTLSIEENQSELGVKENLDKAVQIMKTNSKQFLNLTKVKIANLEKLYNAKKLVVNICIILILLASINIFFTSSNLGKSAALKTYGYTKNADKLINYIKFNNSSNNEKLTKLAIDEISKYHISKGIEYLDSLFLSNKTKPGYINNYIVSEFNKYKIKFRSSGDVCNFYIDNYNNLDNNLKNELILMMKQYSPKEIEQDFCDRIKTLYDNKKIDEAISFTNNFKSLNIGDSGKIDNVKASVADLCDFYEQSAGSNPKETNIAIVNLIKNHSIDEVNLGFVQELGILYNKNSLNLCIDLMNFYKSNSLGNDSRIENLLNLLNNKKNNEDTIASLTNQINDINNQMEPLNSKIGDIKKAVDDANSKANDFRKQISNAQSELLTESNYTNLRFYVIYAETNNNYEVMLENGNHAILHAIDTKFSSKGWTNMYVYYNGTENINLKPELGGFEQKWSSYNEVSQKDRDAMFVLNIQINDAKNKLQECTKQVNDLSNQISDITNNNIKVLNDKKNILLAKQKELQNKDTNYDSQIKKDLNIIDTGNEGNNSDKKNSDTNSTVSNSVNNQHQQLSEDEVIKLLAPLHIHIIQGGGNHFHGDFKLLTDNYMSEGRTFYEYKVYDGDMKEVLDKFLIDTQKKEVFVLRDGKVFTEKEAKEAYDKAHSN